MLDTTKLQTVKKGDPVLIIGPDFKLYHCHALAASKKFILVEVIPQNFKNFSKKHAREVGNKNSGWTIHVV